MALIRYCAADDTMGDTPPAACAAYRAWAQGQLEAAYPGYAIEVVAEPAMRQCWTDDIDNEEEIADFCARLWDTCAWDWDFNR